MDGWHPRPSHNNSADKCWVIDVPSCVPASCDEKDTPGPAAGPRTMTQRADWKCPLSKAEPGKAQVREKYLLLSHASGTLRFVTTQTQLSSDLLCSLILSKQIVACQPLLTRMQAPESRDSCRATRASLCQALTTDVLINEAEVKSPSPTSSTPSRRRLSPSVSPKGRRTS